MRTVLICGGRDYADQAQLFDVLDAEHRIDPITRLVHGGASGADQLARLWAERAGVSVEVYQADWKTHGKSAGPQRNQRMLNRLMLNDAKPALVIGFPGGKGTADMMRRASAAGVPVRAIRVRVPK